MIKQFVFIILNQCMMDTTTRLNDIIINNSDNIAFIIGNGINLRFFKGKVLLWKELIKRLSSVFLSDGSNTPDISLTELFDLIELDATSNHGIIKEFVEYAQSNKIDLRTALSYIKSVDSDEIQKQNMLFSSNI